jgi:4-hydroxy-tetrahydrodipicolinate synthase
MKDGLRGVIAALVTPMGRSGEIELNMLEGLIERLIKEGVHGLVPLGSTGEFFSLNGAEREAVLRTTFDACGQRIPVVVGATEAGTRETIENCVRAEKLGAAAVLLAAPFYATPTPDELVAHFRSVDRAIGIPIVLYNCPGRTHVDMKPETIERLAELKNVSYVKESSGDLTRTGEIIRRCGRKLTVLCGSDGEALASFSMGSAGWVSGAANFLGRPMVQVYEMAVVQGKAEAARTLFYRLLPVLSLLEGEGKYAQYTKAACEVMGIKAGPPRPPLYPAMPEERKRLKRTLLLACN